MSFENFYVYGSNPESVFVQITTQYASATQTKGYVYRKPQGKHIMHNTIIWYTVFNQLIAVAQIVTSVGL